MTPIEISALITAVVPLIQFAFKKLVKDDRTLNVLLPHVTGVLLAVGAHVGGVPVVESAPAWHSALVGVVLGAAGRAVRDVPTYLWRFLR